MSIEAGAAAEAAADPRYSLAVETSLRLPDHEAASTDRRVAQARWLLLGYAVSLTVVLAMPQPNVGNLTPLLPTAPILHALALVVLTGLLFHARPLGDTADRRLTAFVSLLLAGGCGALASWWQSLSSSPLAINLLLANLLGPALAFAWLSEPMTKAAIGRWRRAMVVTMWGVMLIAAWPMIWLAVTQAGNQMMVRMNRQMGVGNQFDDICHLAGGFVLFWLLLALAPRCGWRPGTRMLAILACMVGSAPALEALQIVFRNGADPHDILAHMAGLLAAVALLAIIRAIAGATGVGREQPTPTLRLANAPAVNRALTLDQPSQPLRQAA